MQIHKYSDREEWLGARRGKITGSRLKDIVVKRGTGKKLGFYELIAERLAIPPDDENPMDRGARLEAEAMARFVKETKKKVNVDLVIWTRDDNDSIAISPDGYIGKTEAVEIKCLGSARHIEALLTQEIPSDYEYQILQYFVVNDQLKTLYMVFYDPRMPSNDFFYITVKREGIKEEIKEVLDYQRQTLKEVDEIVLKLSNF
jgi:putative phage-type endonuclease